MTSRPPFPPFSHETAVQKVRMTKDAWNARHPERVVLAYAENNQGITALTLSRAARRSSSFSRCKWGRRNWISPRQEPWAFTGNRIAMRFAYEWHDDSGTWFLLWQREIGRLTRRS